MLKAEAVRSRSATVRSAAAAAYAWLAPSRAWFERREQHDEGTLTALASDFGGEHRPVGFEQAGLDRGQGADRIVKQLGAIMPAHSSQDRAVAGHDGHPVAGVAGECSQQEGRIHRSVEARLVVDPSGAPLAGRAVYVWHSVP